jgi:hypothetical protein
MDMFMHADTLKSSTSFIADITRPVHKVRMIFILQLPGPWKFTGDEQKIP